MIVKVQLSMFTTEHVQQALVYNEDRSVLFEGPAAKDVLSLMGEKLKAYFHADLKNGVLQINEEAPEQEW
jgi:hypothetical protein